ncbi:unnamed protein product [Oikopleura dioica]|uniref:Glycolipid transfer protein domain-containing protein n=1 Tax=Oikopleura dioica TaxID=34765 RepID=E4WYW5_OIKDI|nr:unnamed protein product [Oikopleura dioica]
MSSETFFKRVTPKFGDIKHEEGIHVEQFLSASRSYLEFYDLFGGTVFAPVKSDVSGNIGKLQGWYEKDKTKTTLEQLLQAEIDAKSTEAKGSATDALLWLKRGLWMMARFLRGLLDGERDSNKTFQKSYDVTLKPHHNWMVQKLFSVGLKMVPDFEGFVELMAPKDHPGDKEKSVLEDMEVYISDMEKILSKIDQFYTDKALKHP